MRNGHDPPAGLFFIALHVVPQVLRIFAVEQGKGKYLVGFVGTVAENHDPVQVVALRQGGVFITNKRGKIPRIVIQVCRFPHILPDRSFEIPADIPARGGGSVVHHFAKDFQKPSSPLLAILDQRAAILRGQQLFVCSCHTLHDAHVLAVICYDQKVQWS